MAQLILLQQEQTQTVPLQLLRMVRFGDFKVRELASQEMKNSAGATWDAATAGNAIGTWSASFG